MSSNIQRLRGFTDILPDATPTWQFVETHIRDVLTRYGYAEIRLPLLEATALFARSIGEATDIVEKEMYTFDDRNGERVTLRPEGTAGCVRAAIQHGLLGGGQSRLWYAGPMFRYERPQRGRYRQFHQVGAEVFGAPGPDIDAEMILMTGRMLGALGLEDLELQLNSLATPEARRRYQEDLVAHFRASESALDAEARRRLTSNPLRVLDSKNSAVQAVAADAPSILDYLDDASQAHFDGVRRLLDAAGQPYRINPGLVRGLDYYGRTVFEWVSNALGAQGTVCAGGRYDGLVAQIGGAPTPGIGFAAGIERLVALVEAGGGKAAAAPVLAYIVVPSEAAMADAYCLAERLRDRIPDATVLVNAGGGSLKSQFRRADRSGARYALVLGDNERAAGRVGLKDLRGGYAQRELDEAQLVAWLQAPVA